MSIPAKPSAAGAPAWANHDTAVLRRKVFSLAPVFEIQDQQGGVLLYCRQKLLSWKDDIRVYADDTQKRELLTIKARTFVDFGAAFDVVDAQSNEKVGVLRRKGLKSIIRDEWEILDTHDQVVGKIEEDSLAFIRHFIFKMLPATFAITLGGQPVGEIKQHFNLFTWKATLDLSADGARALDRRLALAIGILIMAIEGRREG